MAARQNNGPTTERFQFTVDENRILTVQRARSNKEVSGRTARQESEGGASRAQLKSSPVEDRNAQGLQAL